MYHLSTAIPAIERKRLPVSRDQAMLLIAATNEIFLGVDIYFAHLVSGTIVPREWIPIIFGPIAGLLLIIAGVIAIRRRGLATTLANIVFIGSLIVGLLGAYFHIIRAIQPDAPLGSQVNIDLLVWAPPILGPLTFALVALVGISAAWIEDPADSGRLRVGRRYLQLPYSKTRAYLLLISLGSLATLISSVFDHARAEFVNPWLWIPTGIAILATVIPAIIAADDNPPSAGEVWLFISAMVLMIAVGLLGVWFHVDTNLIAEGTFVGERFLRGAPFMAPLLYCNMGMLGLLILMDPREKQS